MKDSYVCCPRKVSLVYYVGKEASFRPYYLE